jgi:hypothetical protein
MNSSLLMTNQYLPDGGIDKLIKKGKNRTPRIIEEGINSFLLQTFNNNLRTGLFHQNLYGYQGIRLPGGGYQAIRTSGLEISSFLLFPDIPVLWYPAS